MDTIFFDLLTKLGSRKAVVGILGMGYVGQLLALRYSHVGFKVLGFDIDENKVARLNNGQSEIGHISDASITKAKAAGMECTTDFRRATEADADAVLPAGDKAANEVLSLPMHPYWSDGLIQQVAAVLSPGTSLPQ